MKTLTKPTTQVDPLIRREPCESCSDLAQETETGAGFCRANSSGDFNCHDYLVCHLMETIALQVAAIFLRIDDAELRRELVESTGDGFDNLLYVQGRGAEFNSAAFAEVCGVARRVKT
jgi:hypothetical protein